MNHIHFQEVEYLARQKAEPYRRLVPVRLVYAVSGLFVGVFIGIAVMFVNAYECYQKSKWGWE